MKRITVSLLLLSAIIAMLSVSGCFCSTGQPATPFVPSNDYIPSPTVSPSPPQGTTGALFSSDVFSYDLESVYRPSDGSASNVYTASERYVYSPYDFPDGAKGYQLTFTQEDSIGKKEINAKFTADGECKSATTTDFVNGAPGTPEPFPAANGKYVDLKNSDIFKGERTFVGDEQVTTPYGTFNCKKYTIGNGTTIWMGDAPAPIKIVNVSPCGEVTETFYLKNYS